MPPALHPRSGFTTSLFTTTLALSFLVVGLPHLLPCPVPARQLAEGEDMTYVDAEGRTRVRRRRQIPQAQQTQMQPQRLRTDRADEGGQAESQDSEQATMVSRSSRECPVPKPTGILGRVMGFREEEERGRRPGVRIEVPPEVEQKEELGKRTDRGA